MPVDDLLHKAHNRLHSSLSQRGIRKTDIEKEHSSGIRFGAPYLKREDSVRLKRGDPLRMSVISLIGVTRVKVDLISYPRST
jgi:hypothetical protein